jgi:zinc/manganese transport system substrate-binding protein
VVATIGDLGALAHEVGGDNVNVKVMAKSTQDPHFVDAKPSLVLDASNANLLVFNGLELEVGWLPPILSSSRNPEIQPGQSGYLDASTVIQPLEVPREKLERSMGDIHPGGNPHYTLDPRNGLRVAKLISQRLAQIDSAHAKDYQANYAKLESNLEAKIAEWGKALAPFKGTPVCGYHKSWIYFTEWAGFDEVAFVEPKPGLPPSAGHVATVLGVLREKKVPLIIQEEWYEAATSGLLADKSGATLVRVPGQTPEKQTYAQHIGKIVDEVVKALKSRK